MIAQYIAIRLIMDLCLAVERKLGICLYRRCREQLALDTLGIREGNAAAEGGEETGMEVSEAEGEGE